jgi:methionyl-tRNA synthetase
MVHAKDNITFHTIIFPGLLIGLEDGLKCPDRIVSAEYLNFNEQKFSKSKGIGLTILEALDRYNVDTLRFHLLRNGPETRDANFTEEEYIMTHNEITNKLGNFINRTLKFKGLTSIPVAKLDGDVEKEIDNKYNEIAECIEKIEFRNATLKIIELLDYANKYYDERKPWVQAKEDIEEFNNTMYTCACLIANISNIIEPFMPATAAKIRKYLNIEKCTWEPVKLNSELMLENIEPLFERM